jgi:hypothetical protein
MGKAMNLFKVLTATVLTLVLTSCSPMPWNYESTSQEVLNNLGEELSPEYALVHMEKGCGIGFDCNDPNYTALFSRALSSEDSSIECLQIIDFATSLGLTEWFDPDNAGQKFSLETQRNEALTTCLTNLEKLPTFEGEEGFAEADSGSINFSGTLGRDGDPLAPLLLSFRISKQREDGEQGDARSTYVLQVSTRFGQSNNW